MSIEPITRLQRFLRVLADSSADMPEPLRNLEKCCCYACGHLDTRPELHTTLEKLIASVRDKSIVPPKPNTRLEKYVAAMAGVWDDELPEPITREDKILFEAASGEDVTLSGNPLMLENCIGGKALKALHVYGKSTQDGTPSPDNPAPIVSAGDSGSVAVKVRGKNLWDNFKTLSLGNVEQKKGTYIATTSTMQVDITSASVGVRPLRLKAGNTYTFSLKTTVSISNYKFVCLKYTNGEGNNIVFANIDFVNFVPERDVENVGFILYDTVAGDKVYDVQLEMGSKATSYEPYREQLLTLPTPTGLPGIPVTSGGNYTDENGQQWVCDEVDLERGVKVQRIASFVIDAKNANNIFVTNSYTKITAATSARLITPQKTNRDVRLEKCIFCEALPWSIDVWGKNINSINYVENNSVDFVIENSYLGLSEASTDNERKTALVKYFTDKPCRVVYRIATPIETPLTPDELAAYKALTAYAPTTVLQATDGAGLEVTYKCNVRKAEKTINDLYAELTAELEA